MQSSVRVPARVVRGEGASESLEAVAAEEPLEIVLEFEHEGVPRRKTIALTMRTPGHDLELAAGFLYTEGVVSAPEHLVALHHFGATGGEGDYRNAVRAELAPGVRVDLGRLERHVYTASSCGVCGKTSIEALRATPRLGAPAGRARFAAALVHRLPAKMREAQALFEATGGLHAAALFDEVGELVALREDVGRHNAVDKVIGARLLAGALPAARCLLFLSGRAGFELVQKAYMAGVPAVAAVGAPTSLAVELAGEVDVTLLGFVREGRFTIYAGADRIEGAG
ncbi:MAG TPA: formate dehydrogenase accessory sulfurtransferase FdhD [Polyangiaceae bacterium]|nr:formate dehydrogenase accessory sulfurtransferase FdhD [Polyangiaceae bacterium]